MMVFTTSEQNARMGDPVRAANEERRTFARRIDCDSSVRPALRAPSRGGAPLDHGAWERSRRGGGR